MLLCNEECEIVQSKLTQHVRVCGNAQKRMTAYLATVPGSLSTLLPHHQASHIALLGLHTSWSPVAVKGVLDAML